jgi:hypothetical protein
MDELVSSPAMTQPASTNAEDHHIDYSNDEDAEEPVKERSSALGMSPK